MTIESFGGSHRPSSERVTSDLAPHASEPRTDAWLAATEYVRSLPLYRSLYGARAGAFHFDDLESYPILERAHLNGQFPAGWANPVLTRATQASDVEYATSSGTTGCRTCRTRRKSPSSCS